MSILTLKFMCPVYVQIDTDEDDIQRVVVGDDQLGTDIITVHGEDGTRTTDPNAIDAAVAAYERCVDSHADWPHWEFGW